MEPIDRKIRSIPEIFRFHRFVDDIIAFSTVENDSFDSALKEALPESLSFNPEKFEDVNIGLRNDDHIQSFEFLGYQFTARTKVQSKQKKRDIAITISPNKIARLKSRVFLSLLRFDKNGDFRLLKDSIRFLSGNYRVYRNRINLRAPRKTVRAGLSFSYVCTQDGEDPRLPTNKERLGEIDTFYRGLLMARSSRFRAAISRLQTSQLNELLAISFYEGFNQKMLRRFSPDRMNQIKEAWSYAE